MNDSPTLDDGTSEGHDSSLSFNECWNLLAAATIGRLGLVVDDHPEIFPVNYVLFDRHIVFRSSPGRKLWGAMASRPGVLEIDGYDAATTEAWSVVARGETILMTDPDETAKVDALGLEPWQPGPKDNYIRLVPRALTGRRFKVNAPDVWQTKTNDARRASFE
ncbi:pyridoxamine 5'-phosphate oxidase family protein [Micrococcaceae bacterium Sec5.1]|uniref:pyridoxamine 5'-phosphate oxidase family protein n=1 Tax=Paenarthrobacter sp. 2TAF44 TaxID=3233018 RepID=UPI003366BFF0